MADELQPVFGSIEAGGTKWLCAVGTGPDEIRDEARINTSTPGETLDAVVKFFSPHREMAAIGVASFGPVELRRQHYEYGHITATPKPHWSGTDVVGTLERAFHVPIGFDTDVNGAALGEGRWGAAVGLDDFVYLTIGTGIGGGAVVGRELAHGLVHPEMGHVSVRRHPNDEFVGRCPFHGDCFEGMASGPAIEERWGAPASQLTDEARSAAIEMEAHYVAEGLRNIVYLLAPQRIIIGGGISKMDGLFPAIRSALVATLAGYPGIREHAADDFVVAPGLGDRSGIAGGFALAELAFDD